MLLGLRFGGDDDFGANDESDRFNAPATSSRSGFTRAAAAVILYATEPI